MVSIDRQAMRSFIEHALDAMWIVDEDGTILYVNAAAGALSGWAPDDLIGQPLEVVLPQKYRNGVHCAHIRDYVARGGASTVLGKVREFAIVTRGGDSIPVELKAFEIEPDRGRRRFGAVMRDIGDRKRAEAENRRLIDSLAEMTRVDELTGLPNRRAFVDALRREIALIRRHARSAVVAILDIDHFKRVNDTYGHACGDDVLRKLARLFGLNLRSPDIIARIGGEEFGIVLLDAAAPEAARKLDRLRESVENSPIRLPGGPDLAITVSIGATVCDPERSSEELLAAADGALYRAKAGGRNRVALA